MDWQSAFLIMWPAFSVVLVVGVIRFLDAHRERREKRDILPE